MNITFHFQLHWLWRVVLSRPAVTVNFKVIPPISHSTSGSIKSFVWRWQPWLQEFALCHFSLISAYQPKNEAMNTAYSSIHVCYDSVNWNKNQHHNLHPVCSWITAAPAEQELQHALYWQGCNRHHCKTSSYIDTLTTVFALNIFFAQRNVSTLDQSIVHYR